MDSKQLAQYIDHTALTAEKTEQDILKLCDEAIQYGFYLWGSDNICIKEKEKIWRENLAWGLCGAGLGDLLVGFMQKIKMVGKSVKWSKIGFYFA